MNTNFRLATWLLFPLITLTISIAQSQVPTDRVMPKDYRNAQVHAGYTEMRTLQNATPDVWEPIGPTGITANCLAVDPTNASTIYVGGLSGLYKTTNGGTHWALTSSQSLNKYVNAVAIHPSNPITVFAWVDDKLLKSTDGGGSWNTVLQRSSSYDPVLIFINATNPQSMLTYADSVYSSADGGTQWLSISPFKNVRRIAIYGQDPNIIYAIGDSSFKTRLYKTTDRGQSWVVRTTQLPTALTNYQLGSLQVSSTDPNVLFAGNWSLIDTVGGFYRSVDGGLTWQKSITGLGRSKSVAVIANDPLDVNSLICGGVCQWLVPVHRPRRFLDTHLKYNTRSLH
jgi:photosystem II stability/assembly factor-like uncharacterized protein